MLQEGKRERWWVGSKGQGKIGERRKMVHVNKYTHKHTNAYSTQTYQYTISPATRETDAQNGISWKTLKFETE